MKTLRYGVLALLAGLLYQCAAVVVGTAGAAGGYLWVRGWLEKEIKAPLPAVQKASLKALKSLDLHLEKNQMDKLKGIIRAESVDGTKIYIKLKALDFHTTRVRIRVGTLGDKDLSQHILKTLEDYL